MATRPDVEFGPPKKPDPNLRREPNPGVGPNSDRRPDLDWVDDPTWLPEVLPGIVFCVHRGADGGCRLLSSSRCLEPLFDLSFSTLAADFAPFMRRIHAEDRGRVWSTIETSARTFERRAFGFRVETSEGGFRELNVHFWPTPDGDGGTVWRGYLEPFEQGRPVTIEPGETPLKEPSSELSSAGSTALLHDLAVDLAACQDLERGIGLCLSAAIKVGDFDSGGAYLIEESSGELVLRKHAGLSDAFVRLKTRVVRGAPNDRLARQGHPIFADYRKLVGINGPEADEGLRSVAVLPMVSEGELVGCLNLASHVRDTISQEVRVAVATIAVEMSAAIARMKLGERLRQREGELMQAQKMEAIGRLASGVAHDFNNVLTSILLNVGLTLSDKAGASSSHELKDIEIDAVRAAELTGQLLSFSRRSTLARRPTELGEVADDITGMLRRLVGEHHRLHLELQPELPPVFGDPARIQQVIVNLVLNARDATPAGGRITIRTSLRTARQPGRGEESSTWVVLSVADTGLGMDEITSRKVFEPFFTTKASGHGTGLGLATVEGIALQHGGFADVHSSPGEGATFLVYFPPMAEHGPGSPPRPIYRPDPDLAVPNPSSQLVLLVEDDAGVRPRIAGALRRLGHRVIEAGDGPEALSLASHLG